MEAYSTVWKYMPLLLKGLRYTILISIAAIAIALVIGTVLSVVRASVGNSRPARVVKAIIGIYISFVRGTPVLIQIYLIYQAIAMVGPKFSPIVSGIIALSLNSGGFMAEIVRGGITAVPKGQVEAGKAIGLSGAKIWTKIILPQVFRVVMPQLTSEFINVIKVSPMLSIIAVVELTRTAQRLVNNTYITIPFYVAIAVIYFIVCALLEQLVNYQKKRNSMKGGKAVS